MNRRDLADFITYVLYELNLAINESKEEMLISKDIYSPVELCVDLHINGRKAG